MKCPRLHFDLDKIHQNTSSLAQQLGKRGIQLTGVTKVALGNPNIAKAMLRGGATSLGDSRIENIQQMRSAGITAPCILLRTPQLSRVREVVMYADISYNTELAVIQQLSTAAIAQQKRHQIVLMVDLGDLREGILPHDLEAIARQTTALPGIDLVGIGTNLACFGGVQPDQEKMRQLSELATTLETSCGIRCTMVSGGNSANINWALQTTNHERINNLRLGEAIVLGCETLDRRPIKGLHTDAITLIAEVIEAKTKPSAPSGKPCQNAFGEQPTFEDRGYINRAIISIGRQDVLVSGLTPHEKSLTIIGSSSDHLILTSDDQPLHVGEEVHFHLNYGALLAAMTSPYVEKVYS